MNGARYASGFVKFLLLNHRYSSLAIKPNRSGRFAQPPEAAGCMEEMQGNTQSTHQRAEGGS